MPNGWTFANLAFSLANKAVNLLPGPGFIFVNSRDQLPAAAAGVITLADETTYFLTTTVDVGPDRVVTGSDTAIIGGSSENCGLISTGLPVATPLLSSDCTLPLRHIFLTAGTALALDALAKPDSALDWTGVNFVDCGTVGTIDNYANTIISDSAFLNSGSLTFGGTHDTIAINNSLISVAEGKTGIIVPASATVSRRFRIIYSALVAPLTSTALNVHVSAFANPESYILDTANFAGAGTRLVGLTADDNEALFTNCVGIQNSADVAQYWMVGNAVPTVITGIGVFVKIAGVTTPGLLSKFDATVSNQAKYLGVLNSAFKTTGVVSLTGTANDEIALRVAVDGVTDPASEVRVTINAGGRVESALTQALDLLMTDGTVEIWAANLDAIRNITATSLNTIVTRSTS